MNRPTRLSAGPSPLGALLEKAKEATAEAAPHAKERVWKRLQRPTPRRPWLAPAAALTAATAVGLAAWLAWAPAAAEVVFTRADSPVRLGAKLPTGPVSTASGALGLRLGQAFLVLAPDTRLRLERSPLVHLERGALASLGEVLLETPAGRVRGTSSSAVLWTRVAADQTVFVHLFQGEAEVGERRLRAPQAFTSREPSVEPLVAGEAPFEIGLVQRLAAAGTSTATLRVEGHGDVALDGTALGQAPLSLRAADGTHLVVTGRSRWRTEHRPTLRAGEELLLLAEAPRTDPTVALGKAAELTSRGEPAAAARLLDEAACGAGAEAELALYELGRTRQLHLSDHAGALEAFVEHRRRFPSGALGQEVALSTLEAHLARKEDAAALAASTSFLLAYPGSARVAEVRLVRGKLHLAAGDLRDALEDFEAVSGDERWGEEAIVYAARYRLAQGEARAAGDWARRYLERFPSGPHADELRPLALPKAAPEPGSKKL